MRGTVAAQLIGVAVLPLFARVFDPVAFGHLQLYQSILTMLIVVPSLRYDVAVLRAEEIELPALIRLCVVLNLAVGAVVTAIMGTASALFPSSFLGALPFPGWILALAMVVSGLAQLLLYVAIRQGEFAANANARVAQAIGYAGSGGVIGLLRAGTNGLIVADIVGRIVQSGWMFAWYRRNGPHARAQPGEIYAVARRYREYPMVSLPGNLINSAGGVLTPIMIYATFSVAVAGQYGLVERALTLPVALIVGAVAQVFSAQVATAFRAADGSARAQFTQLLRWLGLMAIGPTIILIVFADPLFALAFGPGWEQAADFARIMAPAYFFLLLGGAVNMTLTIVGRQKTQMAWEVARLAAMIGVWAGVAAFDLPVRSAIILHAITLVATSIAFLMLCHHALRPGRVTP